MSLNKVTIISTVIENIKSGHTIMVGGFGLIRSPLSVIDYLTEHDVSDLTVISNNVGEQGEGLGILLTKEN